MLIEIKSFLNGSWKLYDDKLVLEANYISLIPTGGVMITNRQLRTIEEKTISLEKIEGVSEIIKYGLINVVVIINDGSINTLNASNSAIDILKSAREYIILYRNFGKCTEKCYLSSLKFEKNQDPTKFANEIISQIQSGDLTIDSNKYELINIAKVIKINGLSAKIRELSLIRCDEFASSHKLNGYSITKISDSTNSKIRPGDYFYSFNDSGDLYLLKIPLVNLNLYDLESGYLTYSSINIIDSLLSSEDLITISSDDIYDFEITGTQVSMTNSKANFYIPNALTTMLTEFVFGSSYTLLKGMSNQMARIESKVDDLRLIQVILKDKSDIRFTGIAIYYDFKRYLGEVKNRKKKESAIENESFNTIDLNSSSKSVLEQMKEFKEMLDLGIISNEEFEIKKKELLKL